MINKGEISAICMCLIFSACILFSFFSYLMTSTALKLRTDCIVFAWSPVTSGLPIAWRSAAYSVSYRTFSAAGSSPNCRGKVFSSEGIWRVREASAPPRGGHLSQELCSLPVRLRCPRCAWAVLTLAVTVVCLGPRWLQVRAASWGWSQVEDLEGNEPPSVGKGVGERLRHYGNR